jgi:hypothetical protein
MFYVILGTFHSCQVIMLHTSIRPIEILTGNCLKKKTSNMLNSNKWKISGKTVMFILSTKLYGITVCNSYRDYMFSEKLPYEIH